MPPFIPETQPVTSLVLGGEYRTFSDRHVKVIRDYGEKAGSSRFLVEIVTEHGDKTVVDTFFLDSAAQGLYRLFPAPPPTKKAYWAIAVKGTNTVSSDLRVSAEEAENSVVGYGYKLLSSGSIDVLATQRLYGEN